MLTRRNMIGATSLAAAGLWTPGLFAEELTLTARMVEGPFYPDRLPLDTDNDLLVINDAITPAVGEVTHLSGRVLTVSGVPIRNAFVEIWQCDAHGAYIHSQSSNRERRDSKFQGYGRFLTDANGRYYFRTIKPVPYPGRTPHIHFGISLHGHRIFTTQMLINGHSSNWQDGLFRRIQGSAAKQTILVDFRPLPHSSIGELAANFDIVLGHTLQEDDDDGHMIRGVGSSERRTRGG